MTFFRRTYILQFAMIAGLTLISFRVNAQLFKPRWKCLGPKELPGFGVDSGQYSANGLGWVESLAVSPSNPKIVYAGSNTGGLYRTKNGGRKWKFVFDLDAVCGVSDIVIDDKNPKELWVSTGTIFFDIDWGYGVLHSNNGGRSWEPTGLSFQPWNSKPLWCLQRSEVNPEVFYACSETRIYKTTDRCKSWNVVLDSGDGARMHFRHLRIHNRDAKKVIASGDGFFVSRDGGNTWTNESDKFAFHSYHTKYDSLPDRFAFDFNPQNNDQLIVAYEYRGYDYIQRSDDFGETWILLMRRPNFNRLDRNHAEVAWHPKDSLTIAVGTVRIYLSHDGGLTFITATEPIAGSPNRIHDDIRELFYAPDGTLFIGNDGGVGCSSDGKNWKDISGKGLTISDFYQIELSGGRIVGGCQDMSSMIYSEKKWENTGEIYGDGGFNLINGDTLLVMQSGRLRYGTFQNRNWASITPPFRPDRFTYPLLFNPFTGKKDEIWCADFNLWSYNLKNGRWHQLTNIKTGITKITVFSADSASGIMYLAKDQPTWNPTPEGLTDRLFRGRYNGKDPAFEDITSHLPIVAWRSISGIEINHKNPEEMFVCLTGFSNSPLRAKVFRTVDGGETFENYSDSLPDVLCYNLLLDSATRVLYLATSAGVFMRKNPGSPWVKLNKKMPALHTTDLKIEDGYLYAATFGGGVWRVRKLK
ncbi:MAG: hypothetical protein GC181_02545 [Bacteroidetes bacterium]|nr:hypothetical protein [Bacteroidota bacterium]